MNAHHRAQQVRQIVRDCIHRRVDGETISDQSLIDAHQELLPELADQLRRLGVIESALCQVDAESVSGQHGLPIRCPHCHHRVRIVDDTKLSDVICPACGSSFGLLDEARAFQAAELDCVGHFKLLDKLGVGAFGTVWSARDTQLDRLVAVKIPRKGQMDPEDAENFIREARAAAQLTHPNIIHVHEVGREGDRVYLVTDLVEGRNLADWLAEQRVTPREAVELCATVVDALDHAHQRGVIHRDLKPSNIILDSEGRPHLADFGLAKREGGGITMTMDGKLLGTPAYMSPEQARGAAHDADRRSDIYSLGVILYELLTGERPFRGSTRMLLHQILFEDAPGPRRLNGRVPKDLETICLKCLEKDPNQRYQTARELADDLQRFLRGQPVRARPITAVARIWRWSKRNPLPAVLGTALVVALIGGLASVTSLWIRARDEAENHRRHLYLSDVNVAQQAWQANDVSRCLELLGRHRPRQGQTDLRDFEWFYLWRLCRRSQVTPSLQRGGIAEIGRTAFSPDGTRLATTAGRTLKLWDLATGKQLLGIEAHQHVSPGLAFSPDGRTVATGGWDGPVKLWDLDGDKEPIWRLEGITKQGQGFVALAFSPDGKLLATNGPPVEVLLWDVHNRRLVRSLKGHQGVVQDVAFSPNGRMLASGGRDKAVWLWDIRSGQGKPLRQEHDDWVYAVAFSADGAMLATGSQDSTIILWNVASRERTARLEGHTSSVMAVAFSPDGKTLASASRDGTVKLWDPQTGRGLDTLKGHSHMVFSVAFSPDGRTLASDSKGEVKMWDLSARRQRDTVEGRCVAFSSNGKTLVTWTKDGQLKLWDTATGELRVGPTFTHPERGCATLSPDATKVAMGTIEGTVVLCDLETDREMDKGHRLPGQHQSKVEFVMFSPSGKHLASVAGAELKLWDLANFRLLKDLEVFGAVGSPLTVAFSPDDTALAFGCQDEPGKAYSLKLWNLTRKRLTTWDQRTSPVACSAFSRDGAMLASGNWDGEIKIWNVRTGLPLPHTIEGHTAPVSSVAFSPRGTRLASTSGDGTVKLWDVNTGDQTVTLKGHRSRFPSVAFSPDDKTLVSADRYDTVKLWRAATSSEVRAAGW